MPHRTPEPVAAAAAYNPFVYFFFEAYNPFVYVIN
jgi:hypothetical protein